MPPLPPATYTRHCHLLRGVRASGMRAMAAVKQTSHRLTGDNYPAHNRPYCLNSQKWRNPFPGTERKDRDSTLESR